jgi:YHS domain-containing protein
MSTSFLRKPWVWFLIGVAALLLLFALLPSGSNPIDATVAEFIEDTKGGMVESVEVSGRYLEYSLISSELTFEAKMEEGDTVRQVLQDAGIEPNDFPPIRAKERIWWSPIPFILISFLPLILIISILFAVLRWVWWRGSARTKAVDPVCGKRVGAGDAAGISTFQDVSYRFCSSACKQLFDANPVSYLLKT